jgi:hypothetical protein
MKKHIKNKQGFIERANMIHNFKYDYSKVVFPKRDMLYSYNGKKTRRPPEYYREAKIIITCPKHGDFTQTARKHIEKHGSGCQLCARETISQANYGRNKTADYSTANSFEIKNELIVFRTTPSDDLEREVLLDVADQEVLSVALWRTTGHQQSRKDRTEYCVARQNNRTINEGLEWLGCNPQMHRLIMSRILGRQLRKDEHVDHINHNGLDNRRENLRIATPSQNHANKKKQTGNYSSRFKGVSFDNSRNKWMSYIGGSSTPNGVNRMYLGRYEPTPVGEEKAARAYDKKALEFYGEFAELNFPSEEYK